jgi:hypothetical protein
VRRRCEPRGRPPGSKTVTAGSSFRAVERAQSHRVVALRRAARHRLSVASPLRERPRSIEVSQEEFARLLAVPLETLRTWDSGRRVAPLDVQVRAARRSSSISANGNCSPDALATGFGSTNRRCVTPFALGHAMRSSDVVSVFLDS